jgi:hypothetical protein
MKDGSISTAHGLNKIPLPCKLIFLYIKMWFVVLKSLEVSPCINCQKLHQVFCMMINQLTIMLCHNAALRSLSTRKSHGLSDNSHHI